MDYQKFNRTNIIIQLAGNILAAALGIANLFIADGYPTAPTMPLSIAYIITAVRIIALTGREDYTQESYAESKISSYADNLRLYILSVIFGCAALALVIVKMIIR